MISLVIILVVLGLVAWLVPMDPRFKTLVYVVAVICVLVFLLNMAGVTNLNLR